MRQLALLRMALISIFASKSLAHEYYSGQCPQFPPMKSFVWEKFAPGTWFVTKKTGTTSCSILQRKPIEEPDITNKMENALLSTGLPSAPDYVSHLDKIIHDGHCKYGNSSLAMEI